MAFFGLFKSKGEKALDQGLKQISESIFPMGESDISRDCQEVDVLTNGKIPNSDLRGFVVGSKTLIAINSSYDDEKFISSTVARSKDRITRAEARDVYVYLAGESMFRARIASMTKGGGTALGSDIESHVAEFRKLWRNGTDKDVIPGGNGDFGLCVDNPIPTVCVNGSNVYLSRLRKNGLPVQARRLGSTSTSVTAGNVDIYQLSQAGVELAKVYICPYHRKDSKLAPAGFQLEL